MKRQDTDVPAPLSRQAFESIAYNAVGRASEINTYPAYALSHSTGNSGWSVGIVQWDFGQPNRGHKVAALLQGYQTWARPEDRFQSDELASLGIRLQRRGQSGNTLDDEEQRRLNSYLRSGNGRLFVDSLNREQLDYKWKKIGEPLAGIQWLRGLQETHPGEVIEIMAMTSKLFNQNEVRGRRLLDHLQRGESTSDAVRDWIGSDGINGLIPAAREAIISGRDQALAGARLLSALDSGDSPLSRRWRQAIQRGDHSLSRGFDFNPDLQLFDAMLRHPKHGLRLLRQAEHQAPPTSLSIRGISSLARVEMAEVQANASGDILLTSTRNTGYALRDGGWAIMTPSLASKRAVDEPDYTEPMRARPLLPTGSDKQPAARDLRDRLSRLHEEYQLPINEEALEQATAITLREIRRRSGGTITQLAFAIDRTTGQVDPDRVIAWAGAPNDPATPWAIASLKEAGERPAVEIWQEIDREGLLLKHADGAIRAQQELRAHPANPSA